MSEQAQALRAQAQALRAQGQHPEALTVYARLAALAETDPVLQAQLRIGEIDSLGVVGREDEGIALGQALAATLEAGGRAEDAARARMNVGNLLYRQDRHTEALAVFEACVLGFSQPALVARARANAANCLSLLGRLAEAQVQLAQAQTAFEAEELPLLAALVAANQGYLHFLTGRYGPALRALTQALERLQGGADLTLEAAKCHADRADIYHALQLFPEALEDYSAALPVLERVPLPYEAARARVGRAETHAALGQTERALADLSAAEPTFQAQKNHLYLGRLWLLRAHLTHDPTAVESAIRAFRRAGQAGWVAEAKLLRTDNSVRTLQAIARTARAWSRGWLECRALQARGALYQRQGKRSAALRAYRRAVAAFESVRTQLAAPEELHLAFLGGKTSVYTQFIEALLERGSPQDQAEALLVLERSRSRLVLERLEQRTQETPPLSEPLEALRRALSEAYHRLNGFPDETRRFGGVLTQESVRSLEAAYQSALHVQTLRHTEPVHGASTALSLEALPLAPEEALVAYCTVAGALHAFVLRPGQPLVLVSPLCSQKALAHTARRLRFHLQRPRHEGIEEVQGVLGQLYDLLVRPLENALAGAARLVLVPDASTQGLPFAALWDGHQALLDRVECTLAPGIALWQAARTRERTSNPSSLVLGLAAPEIPAAVEEAQHVAALLNPVRLFVGEGAVRSVFFAQAAAARTIHLATHALFRADNPHFSCLQLADGWLLAHELSGLRLTAEVVTLSACQTGLGTVVAGGDTLGLVRAFLTAGARSVVASLWNADDAATQRLMERFYEHISTHDAGIATALHHAQRAVREQHPHPYYWAAFQVFGA